MIDRVKAAAAKDRTFLIATVNADTGRIKHWDMTKLASSPRADRYERFRTVLLAATAYPVLFPPVMIDGEMHIDGGTREQIFGEELGTAAARAYRALNKPQTALAYLVINGQLVVPRQCVATRIPPIAFRTIAIAMLEGAIGNLYKIGAHFPPPEWKLHVSMIPDDVLIDPANDSFDTEQMKRVYAKAIDWTQTMPWINTLDGLGTTVSLLPCAGP